MVEAMTEHLPSILASSQHLGLFPAFLAASMCPNGATFKFITPFNLKDISLAALAL